MSRYARDLIIPKKIKTERRVFKFLSLKTLIISVTISFLAHYIFKQGAVFNAITFIISFILSSSLLSKNPNKMLVQSISYFISRDRKTYSPIEIPYKDKREIKLEIGENQSELY